jgi:hypothetical protein
VTLIIAVKCHDGVVVGADSAATLGVRGAQTVRETVTKLEIIKDALILGVSGPVGLAQRYAAELDHIPKPDFNALAQKPPHDLSTTISGLLWKHAGVEYPRAQMVAQAMGSGTPLVNVIHQTLIAFRCRADDRLFQFTETCAPEEATKDLPYVSIGSGQQNADPFLAFIRRIFWPRDMPNLQGGIFATLWALTETTESSPGNVGPPFTLAILESGSETNVGKTAAAPSPTDSRPVRNNSFLRLNFLPEFK